ncbi:MAG: DNA-binding protein YbiB [Betaproteobacteria bacterium]
MSLAAALREIGRGREGARALSQAQACEVFEQILEGQVSGVQLGAFCAAMRIKGETPAEMLGFLQATAQVQRRQGLAWDDAGQMPVVLPSYNGSRRLPCLTPLLALLLAERGVPVLVHGMPTEDGRVHAFEVFARLGLQPGEPSPRAGQPRLAVTASLSPGLADLLALRRQIGLRNSGHSLVKLMNPCAGPALVVGSYTHPEYALSMRAVFEQGQAHALLLRGTEGEPVADPRRAVAIDGFAPGVYQRLQDSEQGSVQVLPELPAADAAATAEWTEAVLQGRRAAPASVLSQLEHLLAWRKRCLAGQDRSSQTVHKE